MVDARRKGADLVVKSESGRGTKTTDTYSLKGIAQALDRVAEECKCPVVRVLARPHRSGKTGRSSLDRLRFAIVIAGKPAVNSAPMTLTLQSEAIEKTARERYGGLAQPRT